MSNDKSLFNIFRICADLVHLFSIFVLLRKISVSRSCAGISLKSQILFLIVRLARYVDLLRFSSLVRTIAKYNFVFKVTFITTQFLIVYLMKTKFRATYDPRLDSFRFEFLLIPTAILAVFLQFGSIYSGLFGMIEGYLWTFSIILESVAIFPQLYILHKTGEAENITTHYLFCLGLYRGLYLLNWIYRFMKHGVGLGGISFLFGIIQTLLYADFFYYYYKYVMHGRKFTLLPK